MDPRTALIAASLVASCSSSSGASSTATTRPPPPTAHVLVTWAGANPIGRERFRDDGHVLTSEITLGGSAVTVSIARAPRQVRWRSGGIETTSEIPDGTVVLENGSWQAYALAGEWYASATVARTVDVFVPSRGLHTPGTILVTSLPNGGRAVRVTIGALEVTAVVSPEGWVTRAQVPAQSFEALPEGTAPEAARRAPPEGITESPWEIQRAGITLRGVLWRPTGFAGRVPVMVLVSGSGPTDRDGNNRLGVQSDCYRMLATELGHRGIATVRFDKRGVGASSMDFDPSAVTLTDLVDDAAAFVERARAASDLGPITLAGHSEGALIALEISQRIAPDALVLLAAPGRTLGALVREQLARQLDATTLHEVDRVIDAVRAGRDPEPVPAVVQTLFAPSVRAYLRSELDVDPVVLLRATSVRTTVIQGQMDAQVTVGDAQALAAARPGVQMIVLPHANHLFKDEATATLPQASYTDPSRPLTGGFIEAVVAAVAR